MGINGGYNQMFCLKLKELRNLNSVKLALQALPTPPPKADFEMQKKKSWREVGVENEKETKCLR